jgi:plastocyanin domain-containing protein
MGIILSNHWMALVGGIAAIAWVNWYFFLAGRGRSAAIAKLAPAGPQQITIVVKGGYAPSSIRVRKDQPVRLLFDRQESAGCSEEVVLGDFGIRKFLPPFQQTRVEFTPAKAGTFEFTCGIGMLRGRIIVE